MHLSDDNSYYLSQTNIARKFRNNITTSSTVDAYFYVDKNMHQSLLVLPNAYDTSVNLEQHRMQMKQWLTNNVLSEIQRWSLVEIDNEQWLIRVYSKSNFYYGALISMDSLCHQIEENSSFENVQVSTLTTIENNVEAEKVSVAEKFELAEFYIQMEIPLRDVLLTLPVMQ